MCEKNGFLGNSNSILRPIHRGILQFVGFDVLEPYISYAPVRMSNGERAKVLKKFANRIQDIQMEKPIDVGIFKNY